MADFERSTMVGVDANAAFGFLSDPGRLPQYLATVTHVDTVVVEGDQELEPDAHGGAGLGEVRFNADAATRHIEWGRPGSGYQGSIDIADGPISSTSQVTIRLHTGGESDPAEVERVVSQAVRNLQRLLSGR